VDYPLPIYSYTVANQTVVSFTGPTGMDTYLWSFGDGTSSTQPNPNYAYSSTGSYSVCLTVTENGCQGIYCDMVNLTNSTLIPDFDYNVFSTTLVFDDNSLGATSWLWNFGDGYTSTDENPIHNFVLEGVYEVCLTVSNGADTLTTCQYINIVCPIPEADYFYATNGLTLNTSNISTNGTEFLWNFGDNTTSFFFDPIHTYAYEGVYDVCLTAANNCGANQLCKEVWIVCPTPEVAFTYEPDNYTINFNSTVLNASAYTWNFGDGITSNNPNPTHTFSSIDNYVVCLEAVNDCGTTLECIDLYVDCLVPSADFTYDSDLLTVTFNSNAVNADSYEWNFGGMNVSNEENPTFTFDSAGTYSVCLQTTNECGTDNSCEIFDLSCLPTSEFLQASSDLELFITSNTSSNASSFLWDFGDGNSSTDFTPFHTYEFEGTYQLCLTASNDCGDITTCETITIVCPIPDASFEYSINDLVVTFTAINPEGAITFDFGDGGSSTNPEEEHIYQSQGTFIVCMYSETNCGIDSLCQEIIINCPPPSAEFEYTVNGLQVLPSATEGPFQFYFWTLNGDTVTILPEPAISLLPAVSNEICLLINNACGQASFCETFFVDPCMDFELMEVNLSHPSCSEVNDGEIELIFTEDISSLNIVVLGLTENPPYGPDDGYWGGYYNVEATNPFGCILNIDSLFLNAPEPLIATYLAENPDCMAGLPGSLTINVDGGTPPYIYSIDSGVNFISESVFTDITAGTYPIYILDENGCVVAEEFNLTGTGNLEIVVDSIMHGSDAPSGYIYITIENGVEPYSYQWSNGDITEDIDELWGGDYTLLVTDGNGCQSSETINVPIQLAIENINEGIRVFPIPTSSILNIQSEEIQEFDIQILNNEGKLISSFISRSNDSAIDISDLSNGIYILRVLKDSEMIYQEKVIKF